MHWHEAVPYLGAGIGFGLVLGFIVGFAAKKVATLVAILVALLFVAVQYLVSQHLIVVNWHGVETAMSHAAASATARSHGMWDMLVLNVPSAGAFGVGFWLGFKKG